MNRATDIGALALTRQEGRVNYLRERVREAEQQLEAAEVTLCAFRIDTAANIVFLCECGKDYPTEGDDSISRRCKCGKNAVRGCAPRGGYLAEALPS